MADDSSFDRDTEWLMLAPPQGLVVSTFALKEANLPPTRQTPIDTAQAAEFINVDDDEAPHLLDAWAFFEVVLGWRAQDVAGAPGGPPLPDSLTIRLPDLDATLEPTWAVKARVGSYDGYQLLVRLEAAGVEPDTRRALTGWEATPQERLERLLRETGVYAGLLITDKEIRLVYAPPGESSGHQAFPIRALAGVPGRPILGGLKLLLDTWRLYKDDETKRLPALLKRSREAQAGVSTQLAAQVLGALHEMLRELLAAERRAGDTLISDLARERPHHLYEGILTLLMRLVFILYAEDRDLIPSSTDQDARWLYDQGYSVRGLFARLFNDESLNPDTMNDRVGGWGQLLALFRLIHSGHASGFIRARGGKLFDPDEFCFIEGRDSKEDKPVVLAVSDGSLLRILRGLMVLDGERISYRALDVESIGSVYETVMGFTVELAKGKSIAIKAGKNNKVPVFVDLDALAAMKPEARQKYLKEDASRGSLTAKQLKGLKEARSAADILTALEGIVDERGSPERLPVLAGTPVLQPTDERRRTGSHYTPRTLTEPIVRYALEPVFERIGLDATPEHVLDLKLCDPAMGSGAFLVEACRQLGTRLQQAWRRWPSLRPEALPDDEDEQLHAKRLVAQRCIYGVDRNPMATDLARLSLWLATLARDHEFEFLDHALKTGDSLVGLTNRQIGALNWDTEKSPLPFFKDLFVQRLRESRAAREEIREAPDSISRAEQERSFKRAEREADNVRRTGDAVIAAYFSAAKPKPRELARQKIESLLVGRAGPTWAKVAELAATLQSGTHPLRPFHWETEFPEVFDRLDPGFDAIVGNPPFAGKSTLASGNRPHYSAWLQTLHSGAHGNSDLVAHFFRRAFFLLRAGGTFGLIATNTIGQGDTRATGLATILAQGGGIARATRRLQWPGDAAVVVSVVHVRKCAVDQAILDGRPAKRISAFLELGELDAAPTRLGRNARAFNGTKVYGQGFLFADGDENCTPLPVMTELLGRKPDYMHLVKPYMGGEDLNTSPSQLPSRYAIDFGNHQLSECANWPELLEIVRTKVLPERLKTKDTADGRVLKAQWWLFFRPKHDLYRAIASYSRVLIAAETSPHLAFALVPTGVVFSHSLKVFSLHSFGAFACLQSRAHEVWARFFASTLEDRLRYTPSDCFANFPFPVGYEQSEQLEAAGKAYHDHRAALMLESNQGLTHTLNRFHNSDEDDKAIVQLRDLHHQMDLAVLAAYGWADLAHLIVDDPESRLRHLTQAEEDDHKYQGRLFWPASVRDEVLARLLALNAAQAAEDERLGRRAPVDDEEDADKSDPDDV